MAKGKLLWEGRTLPGTLPHHMARILRREITMSAGLLVWAVVLAFLGLNTALVAWLVLRLTVGGLWAAVGFQAILLATICGILQLIA